MIKKVGIWIRRKQTMRKIFKFAIGGIIGAIINWAITISLTEFIGLYYILSSLIGAIVNILFNFVYHRYVTFNVTDKQKDRFIRFAVLNTIILILYVGIIFWLTEYLYIKYFFSMVFATLLIFIFNFMMNQFWVFFVQKDIFSEYKSIKGDFYVEQSKSKNPLRSWFHTRRQEIVNSIVQANYCNGMSIYDFGSGNCVWNSSSLPAIGIDLNEKMLKFALESKRIIEYKVEDINNTSLNSESADLIVASEIIEHIINYESVIKEMWRVLKPGGVAITSVPYDTNLSFWKPLFFVQCLVQGYIFNDIYYKNKCGHVNHFSPTSIRDGFEKNGFILKEQFDMRRFTIFTIFTKPGSENNQRFDDITVIIPTLNEAENIGQLLKFIKDSFRGIKILVCDDGSIDNTREIVSNMNNDNDNICLIDRSDKKVHGLAASVLEGISNVNTDYFIVMDGDFQHPPEKIREIVNSLRLENDLVIACRTHVPEWGYRRKVMSYVATMIGKISLIYMKKPVKYDILSGFFGADTKLFKDIISENSENFNLTGYKILFDSLKLIPKNTRISEVFYTFQTRRGGKSKIGLIHIWIYFKSIFK